MANKKFQRTIENFVCEHCGEKVIGNGYTNHCPKCLWSKHIDNNPGDRANLCHGLMEPINLIVKGKEWIIIHQCQSCGKIQKNKAVLSDNREKLVKLSHIGS